jgi:hypothetical protein
MRKLDLTGKQFGRLTVTHPGGSVKTPKGRYTMWWCKCRCGQTAKVRTSHLTESRVRSCGCLFLESLTTNPRGKKPEGCAYLRYVYGYYAKNAHQRNLKFCITLDEFCTLVSQPCAYCGAEPRPGKNKSRLGRPKVFNGVVSHNGLDRINNLRGYDTENVVPCCETCNKAKRILSLQEFKDWVIRVHNHIPTWPTRQVAHSGRIGSRQQPFGQQQPASG